MQSNAKEVQSLCYTILSNTNAISMVINADANAQQCHNVNTNLSKNLEANTPCVKNTYHQKQNHHPPLLHF